MILKSSIIDPKMNENMVQQQQKELQEQLTDTMIASIIEGEKIMYENKAII